MREIITNNYRVLNGAIDTEYKKIKSLLAYLNSRVFINYALGSGAFILLLALAWYVYSLSLVREVVAAKQISVTDVTLTDNPIPQTMKSSTEENLKIRQDLIRLEQSDRENLSVDQIIPPEKQYTAFTRIESEGGDVIVTGRVFDSGAWDKPVSQYYYLAIPGMVGGQHLAEINSDGAAEVADLDALLTHYAKNFCRFE